MTDTIVALSSGAPPAAIAIVRASGPQAFELLDRLAGAVPPPRRLVLRPIRDDVGDLLDRALVAAFPAAGSVTGEDLVELHLHGGRATVDAVLAAATASGLARPARAGEFTWRAFRNGKLDLIGVESLSDLLRAETQAQRRAALASNNLSRAVESCRVKLLHLSALVEAALDQSDEDDVPTDRTAQDRALADLRADLATLLARPSAERLFDGIRVVFAGPPNAGKSTLINVLAGREVAIVSPIAGTTRDAIEAPVAIAGTAFVLTDTAGLRPDSDDPIEREGIARAQARIDQADIIVWLDDESPPPSLVDRAIPIHARADLPDRAPAGDRLAVSAATGAGLDALVDALLGRAGTMLPAEAEATLSRRQRAHLTTIDDRLASFATETDELIAAEHLRHARLELDAFTGRAGTDDMLNALFEAFCIGK